jgi:hypothetical protein
MYVRLHVGTFYLIRFYSDFSFLDKVSKNTQIPNFTKIRVLGAVFFSLEGRTDRRTDMKSQIVEFCDFANASKIAT